MDIHTYLKEWAVQYFRNKDIVARNIVSVEQGKDVVILKYKDHEEQIMPLGSLEEFNEQPSQDFIDIIVFNSHKNFKVLLDSWEHFIRFPNLKLFFINPFSEADHKWIVSPAIHHRVSDEASLKRGLQAMFDTVATLDEAELKENLEAIESL
ncbi:hypothetical protein HYV81_00340 [Candidatus Woesearchaeota archaeon]|nr:hypothetical protein [Candidatus Woesearchaeota archaeon]